MMFLLFINRLKKIQIVRGFTKEILNTHWADLRIFLARVAGRKRPNFVKMSLMARCLSFAELEGVVFMTTFWNLRTRNRTSF